MKGVTSRIARLSEVPQYMVFWLLAASQAYKASVRIGGGGRVASPLALIPLQYEVRKFDFGCRVFYASDGFGGSGRRGYVGEAAE